MKNIVTIPGPWPMRISKMIVLSGAARSESQAKQLILQKVVDLDGKTVTDPFAESDSTGQVLMVGNQFRCQIQKES